MIHSYVVSSCRFIDNLSQKRRQIADSLAPRKISVAEAQARATEKALKENKDNNLSSVAETASKFVIKSDPSTVPATSNNSIETKKPNDKSASLMPQKVLDTVAQNVIKVQSAQQRALNSSSNKSCEVSATQPSNSTNSVDEFIPDEYDDKMKSFLFDDPASSSNSPARRNVTSSTKLHLTEESSTDEENESGSKANPMVAALEEDVDEKDMLVSPFAIAAVNAKKVSSTVSDSDEEEQEDVLVADDHCSRLEHMPKFVVTDFEIGAGVGAMGNDGTFSLKKDKRDSSTSSKGSSHKHSSKSKKGKNSKKSKSKSENPKNDLEAFLSGDVDEGSGGNTIDVAEYESL